ncbi:MAG: hypothetical protein FJX78_08360 [Armatimonadetes bacterium]|nr:hypothetical protein [Armatimonadota bacterium]
MSRSEWWVAAALRLPLLFFAGHPTDAQTFIAWVNRLATVGPWEFYEPGFADDAPGYLLVLWPVGFVTRQWPAIAPWLIKVIPALADFIAAASLAKLAVPVGPNVARAFLCSPAVLFAGAC